MAKFTLNAEFDTVEELRAFLTITSQVSNCANTCVEEDEVGDSSESGTTKKSRKRRTKEEIAAEAAKVQAEEVASQLVQPTAPAPEPEVVVVPASAIEVLAPGEGAIPPFDLGASLGQAPMQAAPVIQIAPAFTASTQNEVAPALPADLLGALSGLSNASN